MPRTVENRVRVPPELYTQMVDECNRRGTRLKDVITQLCMMWLYGMVDINIRIKENTPAVIKQQETDTLLTELLNADGFDWD